MYWVLAPFKMKRKTEVIYNNHISSTELQLRRCGRKEDFQEVLDGWRLEDYIQYCFKTHTNTSFKKKHWSICTQVYASDFNWTWFWYVQ